MKSTESQPEIERFANIESEWKQQQQLDIPSMHAYAYANRKCFAGVRPRVPTASSVNVGKFPSGIYLVDLPSGRFVRSKKKRRRG